jgi:hypothetical protein
MSLLLVSSFCIFTNCPDPFFVFGYNTALSIQLFLIPLYLRSASYRYNLVNLELEKRRK